MSHNFKFADLKKLADNDALENHPHFAKVWRDLECNTLLVTITDDFAWFPESYEFLGYIHQAQQAYQKIVMNPSTETERYPSPAVSLKAADPVHFTVS